MHSEDIQYFDGQQKLIGKLFYNQQISDLCPAIILFSAIEGRGHFSLDYAKKLAKQGYIVFAADMYGDAAVESTMEGCFKLIAPFLQDRELVRRRAILTYEALLQQKNVDKNKIGAIGFCFGGMCVLELARSGAHFNAGVTMHGILSKSNLPTHPIKSKLLMLHGYQDPQVPPDQLQPFAEELDAAGVTDWTFTFFGHAKHSFTDPKTGTFDPVIEKDMGRVYDPVAAERSYRFAIEFFRECLLNKA